MTAMALLAMTTMVMLTAMTVIGVDGMRLTRLPLGWTEGPHHADCVGCAFCSAAVADSAHRLFERRAQRRRTRTGVPGSVCGFALGGIGQGPDLPCHARRVADGAWGRALAEATSSGGPCAISSRVSPSVWRPHRALTHHHAVILRLKVVAYCRNAWGLSPQPGPRFGDGSCFVRGQFSPAWSGPRGCIAGVASNSRCSACSAGGRS